MLSKVKPTVCLFSCCHWLLLLLVNRFWMPNLTYGPCLINNYTWKEKNGADEHVFVLPLQLARKSIASLKKGRERQKRQTKKRGYQKKMGWMSKHTNTGGSGTVCRRLASSDSLRLQWIWKLLQNMFSLWIGFIYFSSDIDDHMVNMVQQSPWLRIDHQLTHFNKITRQLSKQINFMNIFLMKITNRLRKSNRNLVDGTSSLRSPANTASYMLRIVYSWAGVYHLDWIEIVHRCSKPITWNIKRKLCARAIVALPSGKRLLLTLFWYSSSSPLSLSLALVPLCFAFQRHRYGAVITFIPTTVVHAQEVSDYNVLKWVFYSFCR